MPVGQMGNYQEYLKRMPAPLREIESTPVRQHMFGNPFKIDKRMIIDEADIDLLGHGTARVSKRENQSPLPAIRTSKIKPGPLPKNYVYRSRSASPSPARSVDDDPILNPPKYINFIPDSDYSVPIPIENDNILPVVHKENNINMYDGKEEQPKSLYDEKNDSDSLITSDTSYYSWGHELETNHDQIPIQHVDEVPETSSSLLSSIESIIGDIPMDNNNCVDEDNYSSEKENTQNLTNGNRERKRMLKLDDATPKVSKKRQKLDSVSVVTPVSQPSMTEESVTRQNIDLRVELYKEIRRPIVRKFINSKIRTISQ